MNTFTTYKHRRRLTTRPMQRRDKRFSITDRQQRIAGFDQRTLAQANALIIGAGGIGGEVCEGLCRKGIGGLLFCDKDVFEDSNLNRQLAFPKDVLKPKAHRIIKNLAPHCTGKTRLEAWDIPFQQLEDYGVSFADKKLFCCGVDN